jgi:hypothetical protein
LLFEGNLKRYLIYAVGEILLIVIGILLALQINAWNSNRINRITEREYLNRLTNELKSDIEYYEGLREKFIEKEKRLRRIIKVWQSDNRVLLDSLQYINDFLRSGDIDPWYNEPVTWNQLIQTGELKLLRDSKVIDALYYHNNMVKRIADNYLLHPMAMTNKAREIWGAPFVDENLDELFDLVEVGLDKKPSNDVYDRIWKNKETYLGLYFEIAYSSLIQHQHIKKIIESGESLLNMLESKK